MGDRTTTDSHLDTALSIDQRLALKTAATRLENEFGDMFFGVETIERFLHSSYDQFASRASIPRLAGDAAVAWSGGSEPRNEVNTAAVEAMAERGIDIGHEYPKPWTDEIVQAADVIVTMGCGDARPIFPGRRYEDWKLDDPAGMSVDEVRPIRDEIERRVRQLLDEFEVSIAG